MLPLKQAAPLLVVVTGPPAAGKTSAARAVADRCEPLACVFETDWWWTTIVRGHVPPWLPMAYDQNRTVIRSFCTAAAVMAQGGYAVVLDGILGPWNLDLLRDEATKVAADVHYVVLRPSLETVLARGRGRAGEERVAGHPALTDEEPIRKMWHEFAAVDGYDDHMVDNTDLDETATADDVWTGLHEGRFRLG